jgi:hypothetical protein
MGSPPYFCGDSISACRRSESAHNRLAPLYAEFEAVTNLLNWKTVFEKNLKAFENTR